MREEKRIALLSFCGWGDQFPVFSAAEILRKNNINYTVFCACRDEVWAPIDHLFKTYNPIRIDPALAENEIIFKYLKSGGHKDIDHIKNCYDEVYVVYSDEMFSSFYAFRLEKYNVSLQSFREMRLLKNEWKPQKKIAINLISSTKEYQVENSEEIARQIALNNKDYEVLFFHMDSWAEHELNYFDEQDWKNLPSNVTIKSNINFIESLELIKECCYGVSVDNGVNHYFQSLGMPRLLLDARINQPPFVVRWRYSLNDSIDQKVSPSIIGRIVKENLETPQTQLLPRSYVEQMIRICDDPSWTMNEINWKNILILKDFCV